MQTSQDAVGRFGPECAIRRALWSAGRMRNKERVLILQKANVGVVGERMNDGSTKEQTMGVRRRRVEIEERKTN